MLMAVGCAASMISGRQLLWALSGSMVGACIGVNGFNRDRAELRAVRAIFATALLTLLPAASGRRPSAFASHNSAVWWRQASPARHARRPGGPQYNTTH